MYFIYLFMTSHGIIKNKYVNTGLWLFCIALLEEECKKCSSETSRYE